jgi:MFS family permease
VTSPSRPPARRQRVFYGWWVVASAMATQMLHNSLLFLSQGLYLVELEAAYRWSRGTISWGFAMVRIETGLLGPLQGWAVDRFGPRPVMLVGMSAFGLGFMGLSAVHTLWGFFAAMAVIAVGSSLAGFLTVQTAIAQWFVRKRSRAISLSSMGYSAGALVAPLVAWSVASNGWRPTAFASGVVLLALGIPLAMLYRRNPESMGLRPDGDPPLPQDGAPMREAGAPPVRGAETDFRVGEAMRDRAFWFIAAGHGMALLVVAAVPAHIVPHLMERNSWSAGTASLVFPGIMVGQVAGQLAGAALGDRLSKRMLAAGAMLGHGGAMLLLAYATSVPAVVAVTLLHGVAWGMRGPLMMAIRADYYGRRYLGTISGWASSLTMGGSIVGPVLAGVFHDRYGDYTLAFAIIGVATLVSTVLFVAARRPPAPARVRALGQG